MLNLLTFVARGCIVADIIVFLRKFGDCAEATPVVAAAADDDDVVPPNVADGRQCTVKGGCCVCVVNPAEGGDTGCVAAAPRLENCVFTIIVSVRKSVFTRRAPIGEFIRSTENGLRCDGSINTNIGLSIMLVFRGILNCRPQCYLGMIYWDYWQSHSHFVPPTVSDR